MILKKLASIDFETMQCVSIALEKYTIIDGIEYKLGRERCAFCPGQIEDVKTYTGLTDQSPEIIYLNAVWTPEVIANYQEFIAQNEENQ